MSDLRLVEFLSNDQYVSTLQRLHRERQQRPAESLSTASAGQLPQALAQALTTRGFAVQYPRSQLCATESSLAASACSLFDVDVAAPEPIRKRSTRTTQRNRRRQKKPRKSSSSSTWRSEDADSDSGWWEEFWNSDSD
jgi:hypothetical protein